MGTVDVSPENVMPDRRQSRSGRSWGGRDEIFVRKIIILLLLMNGHDALLAWRKEGCGICGGGAEEMGWQLGWKGKGEGGVGQDGEWRDKGAEGGERNANEARRPRKLRRRRRIGCAPGAAIQSACRLRDR